MNDYIPITLQEKFDIAINLRNEAIERLGLALQEKRIKKYTIKNIRRQLLRYGRSKDIALLVFK